MSYGIDLPELGRRFADMVGEILKGARPGEISIFRPTKFELIINLRTAKAAWSHRARHAACGRRRGDRMRPKRLRRPPAGSRCGRLQYSPSVANAWAASPGPGSGIGKLMKGPSQPAGTSVWLLAGICSLPRCAFVG